MSIRIVCYCFCCFCIIGIPITTSAATAAAVADGYWEAGTFRRIVGHELRRGGGRQSHTKDNGCGLCLVLGEAAGIDSPRATTPNVDQWSARVVLCVLVRSCRRQKKMPCLCVMSRQPTKKIRRAGQSRKLCQATLQRGAQSVIEVKARRALAAAAGVGSSSGGCEL